MKRLTQYLGILFLTLCAIACSQGESSPEKATVEKYVKAMCSGDVDAMMDVVYIPKEQASRDGNASKSKLQFIVSQSKEYAEKHGGLDKVEYQPTQYLNDEKTRAIVKFNMIFKDGTVQDDKAKLSKVDGKWLIELN
jgi:hypothetical protein